MNCYIKLGLLTCCSIGKMGSGIKRNQGFGVRPPGLETLLTSDLTGLKLIAEMLSVTVCKFLTDYLVYRRSSVSIALVIA